MQIKILKKLPSRIRSNFFKQCFNKKWVQIELPSGEKRWIYKKLTSQVKDYGAILDTVDIAQLKKKLIEARKQARSDSNTKKIKFLNKKDVENLLIDNYTLSVFVLGMFLLFTSLMSWLLRIMKQILCLAKLMKER